MVVREQPFTSAPITILEGPQRSGKSSTAVARVVHPTLKLTAEEYCQRHNINAKVVWAKDIVKMIPVGIGKVSPRIIARQAVIMRNGQREKLIIPKSFPISKGISIFCNFHLYGLYYHLRSFSDIIRGLADGSIKDGYLIIDQAEIAGNAREGMSAFNKALTKYSNQLGKRHLHTMLLYPHEKMGDWIYRFGATERISCSYDDITQEVTLYIRKKGDIRDRPPTSYWVPQYMPYYDTDELIDLTNGEVNRALEAVS